LIAFLAPADWAGATGASIKANPARMTARRAVRYNMVAPSFAEIGDAAMAIDINDKAPDFTLPDQNGEEVSLKAFRGKYVVLFFYPRADTPGCTIEACEFRDSYRKMQNTGAVLLGISPDTAKAQKKFEEKYSLPFTLLGDAEKKVCNAYDVIKEKNMYGKKVMGVARTTFIIGPDGKIKHIFHKVKPEGHSEEVLAYLKGVIKGAA
jgi:peroxiredoxin Q/BCP